VKVVKEYRAKYAAMGELLESNSRLVSLVHRDVSRLLSVSRKGRKGDYTSEEILRSLIVMFVEGDSYRDVVIRIDTSDFLREFVGLGFKPMMDYTFLSKAYGVLSPETWEAMNGVLGEYAREEEKISGEQLRVDTTVYETNIHYPTDSSLLWDSFRTLARLLKEIRAEMELVGLRHRFHVRKVKKLAYFISRNGGSTSKRKQRKVKGVYGTLIQRVTWIAGVAREAIQRLSGVVDCDVSELEHYVPIVERIIYQSEKRVLEGVKLAAEEKVYSLFEEHTELLKRGKAGKPVEFGHKVLVAQSEEKFITHYAVFPKREEDKDLVAGTLAAHEALFGDVPSVLAADKGFYESREQLSELGERIETVSIAKKGSRTAEEKERESTEAFKEGQRFRAGSEGSISVLKRAFKLNRCLFKGFRNYAASVGCAVFCHNLVLLTRL
jgi:IS5 family transposase